MGWCSKPVSHIHFFNHLDCSFANVHADDLTQAEAPVAIKRNLFPFRLKCIHRVFGKQTTLFHVAHRVFMNVSARLCVCVYEYEGEIDRERETMPVKWIQTSP